MKDALIGALRDQRERDFQKWYATWAAKTDLDPNPDDPRHQYDYRAAFLADATPQIGAEDGHYHWPSTFKTKGHPRRVLVIDGVPTDTATGERVAP